MAMKQPAHFRLQGDAGFNNINIDLMYALPNQTNRQAMADLQKAIALAPETSVLVPTDLRAEYAILSSTSSATRRRFRI